MSLPSEKDPQWVEFVKKYLTSTRHERDEYAKVFGFKNRSNFQCAMSRRGIYLSESAHNSNPTSQFSEPQPKPEPITLPIPKIELRPPPIQEEKEKEEEQVLLLSDTQFGLKTKSFNKNVALKRMGRLYSATCRFADIQRKFCPVNKLNIFLIGDICHGELIGKQVMLDELELTLDEQKWLAYSELSSFIINACQWYSEIEIICVTGNHGILGKYFSFAANWNIVVYDMLKVGLLNYPQVKISVVRDDFYAIQKIQNLKFLILHGDKIPMYLCVDDKTECLTEDGFKKYSDLIIGEKIVSYNINEDALELQALEHITINNYDGEMVHVKHRSLDMLLTPNHRCIVDRLTYRQSNGKRSKKFIPDIVKASNLNSQTYPLLSATLRDSYPEIYSDDIIRLCGWILTEGSIQNKLIKITQSHIVHSQYTAEIEQSLANLGAEYTKRVDQRRTDFYIRGNIRNELLRLVPQSKPFPKWIVKLPTRQLRIMFDTLMKGDGAQNGEYFWQSNNESNDVFQHLATICGFRSHKARTAGHDNAIFMPRRSRHAEVRSGRNQIFRENHKGIVWCPTVKNGAFIARRNGKVFITGNSLPFYGIDRRSLRWNQSLPPWDVLVMGHFHSLSYIQPSGIPIMINGTLSSDSRYVAQWVGVKEIAEMWTFFVGEKCITGWHRIDLMREEG